MINFNLVFAKCLPYIFLIFIIYWFPFFSPSFISKFRLATLIFVIIIGLFVLFKSHIKIKTYILINILCIYLFFYESINKGDGSYVILYITILLFYFLGFHSSKIKLTALKKPSFYFLLILTSWVCLANFFDQINFQNSLKLDYEYADVRLSSTGFSLARTSWGLSVFLVAMFFFHIEKNIMKKLLIFIIPFISTMTTTTRGGMLYFSIAAFFLIVSSSSIKVFYKTLLSCILLISIVGIVHFLGDSLRLTGVEDISTGRFDQYRLFSQLIDKHTLFGTYSEGFYDLTYYGSTVELLHNSFLNILVKFGVIGAFPIYYLLISSIIIITKNFNKEYIALYMLILGGIVSTQLEPDSIFSYGYHILIFWFFLGYLTNSKKYD